MRRAICFDDVLLEPRYSNIETRVQIELSTELTRWRKDRLRLPIISAPMDTVTGTEMAIAMYKAGALGILHRYNTIEEQVSMVKEVVTAQSGAVFGAAVGITGDFEDRAVCATIH